MERTGSVLEQAAVSALCRERDSSSTGRSAPVLPVVESLTKETRHACCRLGAPLGQEHQHGEQPPPPPPAASSAAGASGAVAGRIAGDQHWPAERQGPRRAGARRPGHRAGVPRPRLLPGGEPRRQQVRHERRPRSRLGVLRHAIGGQGGVRVRRHPGTHPVRHQREGRDQQVQVVPQALRQSPPRLDQLLANPPANIQKENGNVCRGNTEAVSAADGSHRARLRIGANVPAGEARNRTAVHGTEPLPAGVIAGRRHGRAGAALRLRLHHHPAAEFPGARGDAPRRRCLDAGPGHPGRPPRPSRRPPGGAQQWQAPVTSAPGHPEHRRSQDFHCEPPWGCHRREGRLRRGAGGREPPEDVQGEQLP